jgi:hypothetical protein
MRPRRQSAIPNVIFILLIANGIIFALQQMNPRFLMINFALWPANVAGSPFMPWQLVTYSFLHGNMTHIFFNMFALWMFGRELEIMMGQKRFLTYYFTCVVGAGLVQLIVAGSQGGLYPTVGASGLRPRISESHDHADFPTDTDEGEVLRPVLWSARAVSRPERQRAGCRKLRTSRWDAVWLPAAILLETTETPWLTESRQELGWRHQGDETFLSSQTSIVKRY